MGVWQGYRRRDGGIHRAQSVLADKTGKIPTYRRRREKWGTRAGVDWRSGGGAIFADDSGTPDRDCCAAGGGTGFATHRGRVGRGYARSAAASRAIRDGASRGRGRVGEEARVRERVEPL